MTTMDKKSEQRLDKLLFRMAIFLWPMGVGFFTAGLADLTNWRLAFGVCFLYVANRATNLATRRIDSDR